MKKLICSLFLIPLVGIALQAAPNFLIITADDMNWDSVGVYGCELPDTTPNIDALAAQGIRYDQAHVASTACMPSRNAINTGRFPHTSGGEGFQHLRFKDVPTIPATLKEGGYFVGILGKVNHSTPYPDTPWDHAEELGRNTEQFYEKSKEVIGKATSAGKPFYLIVNSHDPHRPYFKHKNGDKALVSRKGKTPNSVPSRIFTAKEVPVPVDFPDHKKIREELADYFCSVRRCDDVVGRLMDLVDEVGIADDTIVMFLSDHGMGTPTAKANAYQDSTRTPLVVRWPGKIPAGAVYDKGYVSAIDIFPTLLDAADLKNPGGMDGVSLLPTFKGKVLPGRDTWHTAFYATIARNQFNMRTRHDGRYSYTFNPFYTGKPTYKSSALGGNFFSTMYAVAQDDPAWAERTDFILTRIPEELYDLEIDPKCLNNLIDDPEHQQRIAEHRKAMIQWMKETKDPILPTYQTYLADFDADTLSKNLEQDIEDSGLIGKAPRSFDPTKAKFAK